MGVEVQRTLRSTSPLKNDNPITGSEDRRHGVIVRCTSNGFCVPFCVFVDEAIMAVKAPFSM